MIRAIANFILFELAWFAAVICGAQGCPILGSLPAVAVVAIYLWSQRANVTQETSLVIGVTALGVLVETAFILLGAIHYAGTSSNAVFPPLWIIALWLAFGTLPHGSLNWLSGKLWQQAILGAGLGPLSYLGGVRLGAATIGAPLMFSLAVIGCGWVLAMILIFYAADRLRP